MLVFKVRWLLLPLFLCSVDCSTGDKLNFFQICVQTCVSECPVVSGGLSTVFQWSCSDNCRYQCMWKTVSAFQHFGLDVPQFYGKWPFVRLFGLQEPASVAFSLLNLAANALMCRRFAAHVPRHAPLRRLWLCYSMVCVNGWLWSAVFHARETHFTELMDYISAFAMLLFAMYSACIRLIGHCSGSKFVAVSAFCSAIFVFHAVCFYQYSDSAKYSYNMAANLIVACTGTVLWLVWCYNAAAATTITITSSSLSATTCSCCWSVLASGESPRRRSVAKCALTMLLFALSGLIEISDFRPVLWLVDAHALWHLVTVPLPLLWYSFLIEDSLYMLEQENRSTKKTD